MLTRLRVKGFKNLHDVDVRFGPFTCIAGLNGIGKSNLFDAILLLSALADHTLIQAVTHVRGESNSTNATQIFSRRGAETARRIELEAEMIVPLSVSDDLDQEAKATIASLEYRVIIELESAPDLRAPQLRLRHESLNYLKLTEARERLLFVNAKEHKPWLDSVLQGRRTTPFISTERDTIKIHEDSGHQGRARALKAESLTRTVLSSINTIENPTILAARREMQSWRLLQLEPARLRTPDNLNANPRIAVDGSGLAAAARRLLARKGADPAAVRQQLVNRVSQLVETIRSVDVQVDEARELLTLVVTDRERTELRARDLSDGTLRFLALAVLAMDPTERGLLCMEEPENGMHPKRIPAMLDVLRAIAVDVEYPVDDDNPLRQVIVNTHSPEFVKLLPTDALLLAVPRRDDAGGVEFVAIENTWRIVDRSQRVVAKGDVIEYLNNTESILGHRSDEQRIGELPTVREQLALWSTSAE
jgi:predicted ATPase